MGMPAFLRLTAVTALALAVLVGLGFWQLQRLEWKQGLIAQIETRNEREPVALAEALRLSKEQGVPRYLPVRVQGRFDHTEERYLYAISLDGEPGWHVITPLKTADGSVVLIDRGFVPQVFRDPKTRQSGQVQEVADVTGLLRTEEGPGLFVPDNDEQANQWFSRDLDAMAGSMFPEGSFDVAPFFLEAVDIAVPGDWPKGGQTRLELPNNHLQYALTWFGLALCLVAVYGVYVWGAAREKRP